MERVDLTAKYGLTLDTLIAAELVTAEGQIVHASAQENPDLFWGIRGGGGNLGVVTSFGYRLFALDRTTVETWAFKAPFPEKPWAEDEWK